MIKKNNAFTLIEVVVSTFILSLIFLTLFDILEDKDSILYENDFKIFNHTNSLLILENYSNLTYKEGNIKELLLQEYIISNNMKQYLPDTKYKYSKIKTKTNSINNLTYDSYNYILNLNNNTNIYHSFKN